MWAADLTAPRYSCRSHVTAWASTGTGRRWEVGISPAWAPPLLKVPSPQR